MPSTFTSYYGSSFHGMEVKWTHDPNATAKTLNVEMKLNWYSPKVYIDSREGGRIDMTTTLVKDDLASKTDKHYELRQVVLWAETEATKGVVKCGNLGAIGT